MTHSDIRLLSIVPYQVIPANTGGRLGIAKFHHYLAEHCTDHIATTVSNSKEQPFAFDVHHVFPDKPIRYIPGYGRKKMLDLAKQYRCTHIICEHPYMALTAISLSNSLKIPWYLHSHNIESERFRTLGKKWWPVLKQYEKYAMEKAAGTFFVAQEDADWVVDNFGISASKCHTTPFGTDLSTTPEHYADAKQELAQQFNLDTSVPWLYFLGLLDYQPNWEAVQYILNDIKPLLDGQGFKCEILIAGKGLNETLKAGIAQAENIHYLGFVPDLHVFLNACDIMLNPVMTGGGIKTKAVEALAYNKMLVSSESGAAGLTRSACGNNLLVASDFDWNEFADKVIQASAMKPAIPESFYKEYYWGNIAEKVLDIMSAD